MQSQSTQYETAYFRLKKLLGRPPEMLEPAKTHVLRSHDGQGHSHMLDIEIQVSTRDDPFDGSLQLVLDPRLEQDGQLSFATQLTLLVYPPGNPHNTSYVDSSSELLGRVEALCYRRNDPLTDNKSYADGSCTRPVMIKRMVNNELLIDFLAGLLDSRYVPVTMESAEED